MVDRLKDKVAIVTGAGSRGPGVGNGKAAAILFAREGASVLCVDLDCRGEGVSTDLAGLLHQQGGNHQAGGAASMAYGHNDNGL